jgi:hypothetical protein
MRDAPKGKEQSTPHLKLGDFVRVKDSVKLFNMNEMSHVRDTLGEPPYVFLEKASFNTHFGVEVYIRSTDQVRFPVRVMSGEGASHDDAVNVYESGVIQIPLSFLEKVTPPQPELAVGRKVRVNFDTLGKLVQPFQYESVKGKYKDKDCRILRIIEAQDVQDPTHTHYFAMLGIVGGSDTEHVMSVPVEALETVH